MRDSGIGHRPGKARLDLLRLHPGRPDDDPSFRRHWPRSFPSPAAWSRPWAATSAVASKPGQGTRFIVRLPHEAGATPCAPPSLDDLPVPSGVSLLLTGEMQRAALTRRLRPPRLHRHLASRPGHRRQGLAHPRRHHRPAGKAGPAGRRR
ncbi:MAG: hypothetical protein WDN06_04930 [Asticcacaulis sp.]